MTRSLLCCSAVLLLTLSACGGSDEDDKGGPDAPTAVSTLPLLPGCRAYLTGTLKQLPFSLAAPTVQREGGSPLTGEWPDAPRTVRFLSTEWVQVPCGAPTAFVEFAAPKGEGRLGPMLKVQVPPGGADSGQLVTLWPEPAVVDDPTQGPTFPIETQSGYTADLTPSDGVADICETSQTHFPLPDIALTAKAGLPTSHFEQNLTETRYRWEPLLDWKYPDVPFELEDVAAVLVCDSAWSFGGGYQLTYENEVEGVVKAKAQHDFWFDSELALVEDDQVLGYYRLYDIAVETSGDVTGSYSGPSEVLLSVEGFFEKDADGEPYVDLPLFQASGITWQYKLNVLGTPLSENNPNILQDHLGRLNLTFPPSPTRPGYFRLSAKGQEDTQSFFMPEGFVIANWGLKRRAP